MVRRYKYQLTVDLPDKKQRTFWRPEKIKNDLAPIGTILTLCPGVTGMQLFEREVTGYRQPHDGLRLALVRLDLSATEAGFRDRIFEQLVDAEWEDVTIEHSQT